MELRKSPQGEKLYANVLIYGPPKTGKTSGASSAPGAVLYINADLPNATRYARLQDTQGRLMEPVIPPFKAGETPVFSLMTEVAKAVYQKPAIADTVVIDPLGELYRRLLEEQTGRSRRPTLDQRGNTTTDVERWCRHMCEASVNFVIVAHEMSADKGEEGLIFLPFTGSKTGSQSGLGPKIAGMVDIIAYTAVVEVEDDPNPKYMAQLINGRGRQGGDRFDVLGKTREVNLHEWFTVAGVHTGDDVSTLPQRKVEPTAGGPTSPPQPPEQAAKPEAADPTLAAADGTTGSTTEASQDPQNGNSETRSSGGSKRKGAKTAS